MKIFGSSLSLTIDYLSNEMVISEFYLKPKEQEVGFLNAIENHIN